MERGDKRVVGVNTLTGSIDTPLEILRISHEVELEQKRVLRARRDGRDQAAVDRALSGMVRVAGGTDNMVPAMIEAARAEATLGEICGALTELWGGYTETPRF
jgi:methylmalonyl-CoA mutase N-terminal domain/subunit